MRKIRVLVVDDSPIMRKILVDLLSKDPQIEVVDTAKNGKEAIEKTRKLLPDVITLDIEMPVMDGLTALKILRREFPNIKVIMFSSLTQEGAKATIEALSLGAFDFVPKPSSKSFIESMKKIESDLIPKIKAAASRIISPRPTPVIPKPKPVSPGLPSRKTIIRKGYYEVLGIGVSTGGPQTLIQIIPKLPANFPAPILIVQHMPPMFTKQLAERLDQLSALRVKEGEQGEPVKKGVVYVAPGDFHMEVRKVGNNVHEIYLHKGPPRNFCRPAVDELFESLAEVYRDKTVGLVLTGMGRDGEEGSRKIKEVGGLVLAQDEQSCVVFGMPRAVIEAGLADEVLNLSVIPQRLKEIFGV